MVTSVAVLDDYQGFAPPHFNKLDSNFAVTYYPDTLLPYNHPATPQAVKDDIVKRLEPFDVIYSQDSAHRARITATMRERTPLPADLINRLPNLKLILSCGGRNKAIDMDAAQKRGIPVTAASDNKLGPVDSTTEHIIALILSVTRSIAQNDAAVKAGAWQTNPVTSVSGKTLGLVGLGRLGGAVARIMSVAFGMKIIAWSTNLTQEAADAQAKEQGLPAEQTNGERTFKAVSREELFSAADVISVHLVLSDRSRGLVTGADLSRMKPSSFFVNTSRGPLVVERDLLDTLKAGKIRGAALDVFDLEPLPKDSEWRRSDWGTLGKSQVLLTPHVAYVEERTINGFYEQQVDDLVAWSEGKALKKTMY
ncbi:D-isomer specific 2-hydroxyacid dehydrogenase [Metarhizium album ARSEF 1941]|uniref:D-isomer specific 2-hydroxyacid dehydrogenase n=1 Tax=Metarhizium album (strain ARSEF 1941) TaxID=1081103 RepID=A0A0B2WDL8_METAS|nr:D-isomer specific 2-hydroxyacid dehydrogenase [Metarhizium album ARSEF 1941]KHN93966.1 D-isomer specific 2-hydroxyacid dehydrogenase [Metarhizium album ARSEF 1941]